MNNANIEQAMRDIEYLLKKSEQLSRVAAAGYDDGWYNGECNAYETALELLENAVKGGTNMNRVDKIVNFAAKKELEKLEKAAEKEHLIEYTKGLIRALKPRIDELLEVGNACLEHNIPLEGKAWGGHEGYDTNQFITNSWSHLLGFVAYRSPSNRNKIVFKQLGIMGGGACNYNLKTDGTTIEVDGDVLWVLKHFVEKFDEFEREFYSYVDSVVEWKQKV